jgi:hypothetical protein
MNAATHTIRGIIRAALTALVGWDAPADAQLLWGATFRLKQKMPAKRLSQKEA